jgi:hypothetical protein
LAPRHAAKLKTEDANARYARRKQTVEPVVGTIKAALGVTRLVGAILLEQSDEWATQRSRYMALETIGALSDTTLVSLPAATA